jgi:guanylate kinase
MVDESQSTPETKPSLLIVISGTSGAGKDTVIRRMKERNLPFHFVITATTRKPRQNEVQGVDYFFLTKDEFAEMIDQGELLEYALVYCDFKGIPKAQVRAALASGKDAVLRVDVQGAATVRKLAPEALLIFITTSEEEMVSRLKKRMTETPEEFKLRIATARKEMEYLNIFDYIVTNADERLDEAVDAILAIITAERCKVKPRKVTL